MLTLYYSHHTRATRILALLHEMDLQTRVKIEHVTVSHQDGSGAPDPKNPHPDKKVPALVDGETLITESAAIMLYLTDMFPKAGLGPVVGDPTRGSYLTWLAWYGDVMEPVYNIAAAELSHPILTAAFRGIPEVDARLTAAFSDGRPYLLGEKISAADLLVQSPFMWFRDWAPKDTQVQAWIDRVAARPSYARANEVDAKNANAA